MGSEGDVVVGLGFVLVIGAIGPMVVVEGESVILAKELVTGVEVHPEQESGGVAGAKGIEKEKRGMRDLESRGEGCDGGGERGEGGHAPGRGWGGARCGGIEIVSVRFGGWGRVRCLFCGENGRVENIYFIC